MAVHVDRLKFTRTHEWVEPSGRVRKVGISDFAQSQLGDIVYVECPDPGGRLAAGEEACLVESCKATASVYAPLAGRVLAYNRRLVDQPELVNASPYEEGWLFELEVENEATEDELMSQEDYLKTCAQETER